MELSLLFQTLITGLAIGGIYSLMAVGYSLVFSILNFSNFAYGGVIMLASFAGYYAMTLLGANVFVALIISMAAMAVVSLATERVAYSPLRKRNAPPMFFMISAMGLSIFIENLVYATIGAHFYAYSTFCTCSRIFSISFLSSRPHLVMTMSLLLEQMVLVSLLNS